MSARGRGRPRKLPEKEQLAENDDLKMDGARPQKDENTTLKDFMEDVEIVKGRARSRKNDILAKSVQNSAKTEDSEKNGVLGKSVRNSAKSEDSAHISEKEAQDIVILSSTLPDSQKERWRLRSMWELAAVLNFLHVFRPVLNISLEFSAEELETALITPNNILSQLHIHLLKGIPPVSRTALVNDTWITAVCKKLAVWWPWVAKGEVPLIICHGEEIEAYKQLDPGTRLLILKALCEIRLDQDDVWKYIDDSLKHSTPRSAFSKLRMGGDSHGISYWYDGDAIIGHRLYRETQKIEVKLKPKGKGRSAEPVVTCQWETVATSFEEFQSLSEKLSSSRNKLEAGIGKKIKSDILPVLEELQKKKERALKKQQRQAMLLDNFFGSQGDDGGRSRRDRKPVKYTFDDYDRSIDEAIQLTKKSRQVPDPVLRRTVENPQGNGNGNNPENALSSESKERSEESDVVRVSGRLTRSNRFRPVEKKFGDNVSDNDVGNEDGEAVYEDGHINKKHRNGLSSDGEEGHKEAEGDEESKDDDTDEESKEDDGDEEYKEDDGDEEYKEDEEDSEDDEDELSIDIDYSQDRRRRSSRRKTKRKSRYDEEESISADYDDSDDDDDSEDQRRRSSRRKRKGKPADEVQSGLRRSKRATRVDYRKYEISNSEEENSLESEEQGKPNGRKLSVESDISNSVDSNVENESSHNEVLVQVRDEKQPNTEEIQSRPVFTEEPVIRSWEQFGEQSLDLKNRHFIDLNEAAPFPGFDDFPDNSMAKQLGPEDPIYDQVKQRE
ncbi:hypothetical protein SUGI_0309320 [Cryptomeria japonica]|uniref:DDT domain-containing protein DDR4 n=1 Tax=Cryptomeria japonica TaxID=3369 RepID=UPI002408C87A|nr:DDT domain-containing protein DDR4 [Cryptomeria japonica]GLJ17724.1 hypothetical protein SUGI_0309320 [Cryptomeria japonica]